MNTFTPEAEKKLLIVEENICEDKSQYKTLKKYTGQPYLLVNRKYQVEYQVRNNINLILLSNEHIPLYVEKNELPTDENNNQFFVYEFAVLNGTPDAHFQQKLRERLGHYVSTELRTVFESIDKNYTRYGIPVPITEYEKQLFENNITNIEATADMILEKIENRISPKNQYDYLSTTYNDGLALYDKGWLSTALLNEYTSRDISTNSILKNLKKRKLIKSQDIRKTHSGRKYTCYELVSGHSGHQGGQQIFEEVSRFEEEIVRN